MQEEPELPEGEPAAELEPALSFRQEEQPSQEVVQRHRRPLVREIQEREHDPLSPDRAHRDPRQQRLRRCRGDIEEWHACVTLPDPFPAGGRRIPPERQMRITIWAISFVQQ